MLSRVQGQTEGIAYLQRVVGGSLRNPLLLFGPEGVGRRLAVLEAAKEAFPRTQGDTFHEMQLDQGVHPDMHILRPENETIGVEAVREAKQATKMHPSLAKWRYFVVDGTEKLTDAAANALLKVLEEPPSYCRFFLLTQSMDRVLPTIRSRCGRVRFYPLPESVLVAVVSKVESDEVRARIYSRMSGGSAGKALRMWSGGHLKLRDKVLSMLAHAAKSDISEVFQEVDSLDERLDDALGLCENLVRDMVTLPFNSESLVNLDRVTELAALRKSLGETKLRALSQGISHLLRFRGSQRITHSFHLKSLLATLEA